MGLHNKDKHYNVKSLHCTVIFWLNTKAKTGVAFSGGYTTI